MIGELFRDPWDGECLKCRVDGGCNTRDKLCGIKRGVKDGRYPKSALKPTSPPVGHREGYDIYGCKEVPVWRQEDKMSDFSEAVAGYTERAIELDRVFAKNGAG